MSHAHSPSASELSAKRFFGVNLDARRGRRTLVVAILAAYLIADAFFWAAFHLHKAYLLGAMASLVALLIAYAGLSRATRAYAFASSMRSHDNPLTDERQAQVRDRSFVVAYQILAAIVSFLVIYFVLATDFGWPLPSSQENVQALFWGVLLLAAALPTMVVAWNENGPDDEARDVER